MEAAPLVKNVHHSPQKPMQASRLLALPGEVKNLIYDRIDETRAVEVRLEHPFTLLYRKHNAVSAVCASIRAETKQCRLDELPYEFRSRQALKWFSYQEKAAAKSLKTVSVLLDDIEGKEIVIRAKKHLRDLLRFEKLSAVTLQIDARQMLGVDEAMVTAAVQALVPSATVRVQQI
jgi:hypothetical protein